MANPAVFLDRDGTLIEEVAYATRPEDIRILGGVAKALAALAQAGYKLIVVTNQSAIARGMLTEEDLHRFHEALDDRLDLLGARVDAYYACPHHPDPGDTSRPDLAVECDCRKPKPGLLLRAAEDFDIDLTASWLVGDTWRDIGAGQAAGVRTIKLPADPAHDEPQPPDAHPPTAEAASLAEAAGIILGAARQAPAAVPPAPAPVEAPEPRPAESDAEAPPAEPVEEAAPVLEEPYEERVVPAPPEEQEEAHEPEAVEAAPSPPPREPRASAESEEAEAPKEEPVTAPKAAKPSTLPAAFCARCGQEVGASDLARGAAETRDGFLLCPECLARQPRDGADRLPDDTAGLLRSILMELRRLNRTQRTSSLTFLRLAAYIVQAAALVCGLGLGLVGDDRAMFMQIGILLQLVVISLLLLERHS